LVVEIARRKTRKTRAVRKVICSVTPYLSSTEHHTPTKAYRG
jgi:hypothetical protein